MADYHIFLILPRREAKGNKVWEARATVATSYTVSINAVTPLAASHMATFMFKVKSLYLCSVLKMLDLNIRSQVLSTGGRWTNYTNIEEYTEDKEYKFKQSLL